MIIKIFFLLDILIIMNITSKAYIIFAAFVLDSAIRLVAAGGAWARGTHGYDDERAQIAADTSLVLLENFNYHWNLDNNPTINGGRESLPPTKVLMVRKLSSSNRSIKLEADEEEPLNWEAYKKSESLETSRSKFETYTILNRTSASISFIASALLITHILRSHQGLSTTYHRLVFGLSTADIIYASAVDLNRLMVPKEMDYLVPGAQGTVATCTAQGFFITVAMSMSTYYNCSICFYYLAIIKFNKSDAYIAKKLERWYHIIPIIVPVVRGLLLVAMKGFNAAGQMCLPTTHNPPHCKYEETPGSSFSIPCGRGIEFYRTIMFEIIFFGDLFTPPIIIIRTMIMMYRTVMKIERNAARYGVRALRFNIQQQKDRAKNDTNENSPTNSIIEKIKGCISYCWSYSYCLRHLLNFCRKPNNSTKIKRVSRKKAVLQMASGYIVAWALFRLPFFIYYYHPCFATNIIRHSFNSLQGLFNFIVFMSPKVRAAMKPRSSRGQQSSTIDQRSWHKVVIKAYMSRGGKGKRK